MLKMDSERTHWITAAFIAGLIAAVLIGVPVLRTSTGTPHDVVVTVDAIGFAGKSRSLSATVRLPNGSIASVGVPFADGIRVGARITVREQPMRFGQANYYYVSSAAKQ